MTALQRVERILGTHRDLANSARVTRELSKHLAGGLGAEISDLRKWHETHSEEDVDYSGWSGNNPDTPSGTTSNSESASGSNMESLREELLRAEADRYTAKTFLEVARQEKKTKQSQLEAMRVCLKTVESQKEVELSEKDVDISSKQHQIDVLQREVRKLQQEKDSLEKQALDLQTQLMGTREDL